MGPRVDRPDRGTELNRSPHPIGLLSLHTSAQDRSVTTPHTLFPQVLCAPTLWIGICLSYGFGQAPLLTVMSRFVFAFGFGLR
jgi:hypothetical protein